VCAIKYSKEEQAKAYDRETRKMKAKIKTKSQWTKEAQAAFNKYIRLRDAGQPCISCQRHHQGQMHAGHYRSIGSAPELRFEEKNNNLQCAPCNNHLSGNLIEYRKGLIAKIGIDEVEWLEGKHESKKYTIEQLKEIKAQYSKKVLEIIRTF
jgi:hypothetical protein